jgi:two-component system alkaline phosphatase synthesis response regulator PhoP
METTTAQAQTVLLVDDEEDILEMLSYNFKKSGFRVVVAKNGTEGQLKAFEEKPAVIVADLWMPEMDGIRMCRYLRTHPDLDKSRIIILSADSHKNRAVEAIKAGADVYLTKPIAPSHIVHLAKSLALTKTVALV